MTHAPIHSLCLAATTDRTHSGHSDITKGSVSILLSLLFFFFSSRRRHTRYWRDWSSDVCSSDLQHAYQRRAVDDAPFILHPLEVASLLSARGCDDAVVAAGLLHDVVEKTEVTEIGRASCRERV